jgi:type IV pilus assembly protein PilB
MPLGLNLISQGLLTIEQLKKATAEQKESGLEIGEFLVRSGFVTEKQVTATRANDWGCPVFSVPRQPACTGISIPTRLMRLYSMIPVHHVAATNSLLVAFVHGVEYGLLYAIEQMTGCQTKPCFVTPSDFELQLQCCGLRQPTPETHAKEVSFEDTYSAAEMAGLLCAHGLEMEADEAYIEKSKDYLWARLKSESTVIDLLFKAP